LQAFFSVIPVFSILLRLVWRRSPLYTSFMEYQPKSVVVVRHENVTAYRELRLRGLREHPEAFGETAAAFESRSLESISERVVAQARLGAFILAAVSASGAMLGCVGLAVQEPGKSRHRGMLWGMYVLPEARGKGVGRVLLDELLDCAGKLEFLEQIHLSVVTSNTAAVRLYENFGFKVFGTDPRVLKVGGQYFDESLMMRPVHL
jgi:ribosomal protein S18 acetylase RimI-like enzyme